MQKGFPKKLPQSRERRSPVFHHPLQKDPFGLDHTNQHCITLLGIFTRLFVDLKNVLSHVNVRYFSQSGFY